MLGLGVAFIELFTSIIYEFSFSLWIRPKAQWGRFLALPSNIRPG